MRIRSKTLRNKLRCIGGTNQQIQWAVIIPTTRNTTHLIVMKRSHAERGHSAGTSNLPSIGAPLETHKQRCKIGRNPNGIQRRLRATYSPSRHNLWTSVRDLFTLRFWFILAQYSDDSVAILMLITFLILQ